MKKIVGILLILVLLITSLSAFATSSYLPLKKGSKGDAVVELQTRLLELGFYSSKVDGSYGNGTATAVKAFEKYNGLNPTGEATVELQEFLYSDAAKGLEIPDVEISGIGLRTRYGLPYLAPTLKNNTSKTINAVMYRLKAYNAAGERLGYMGALNQNDIVSYDGVSHYMIENATGEINGLGIKPGASVTLKRQNQIDVYTFDYSAIDVVYMAVIRYVTTDGTIVNIPENEQIWYGSDGTMETIEYENNLVPRQELTFEMEERADEINLGFSCNYIPNFFAEVIDLPVGGIKLSFVIDRGPASDAGLKDGDIIVKIGDVWTIDPDSLLVAKANMDEYEPTSVVFYRRGQRYETEMNIN